MINSTSPPVVSTTAKIGITQGELWVQLVLFYGLMGGVVSAFGYTLMASAIVRNKELRSRFFVILWFILVARALMSSQYALLALYRSLRTLNLAPMNMKRVTCFILQIHFYTTTSVDLVLLVVLAVDRVLAIVAYQFYSILTEKQAAKACAIASVVTVILKVIPSLFGVDYNEVIPCVNAISPMGSAFNSYHSTLELALAVMTLLLYGGLVIYIRFYIRPKLRAETKRTGDSSGLMIFKRQCKLLPLLQRLILMHSGLTLLTKASLSASGLLTAGQLSIRVLNYSGIIATVDLFATLVMLLASNKELKQATFSGCGKSPVAPMIMVQPAGQGGSQRSHL